MRARWIAAAVVLLGGGGCRERSPIAAERAALFAGGRVPPPADVPAGATFVVAAAGDVAGRLFAQGDTAHLLEALVRERGLKAILGLGDLQYPRGEYHSYLADYAPTWGRPALRALTRPVPGNHEYDNGRSDARGYFDYFNGPGVAFGQAGQRGHGYYSFDMGDWHLVALNTSDGCRAVPCARGAPMHRWLREDLARNQRPCVLAYFHHPRFGNGETHGDAPLVQPLWEALLEAGADLVLSGHEHNFQQLAPLDRDGRVDRTRGLRSFIVGTGGARHYPWFSERRLEAVEARVAGRHGVLELTLGPGRYAWRFAAVGLSPTGDTLASGEGKCR